MKSLACCALLLMLTGFAAAEPQVIIDTDFGVPGKSFAEIAATKGIRITGRLPEGWDDNSNWKNNVVADYKPIREGDQRFLRVQQTSGEGLQFMHDMPGMEKQKRVLPLEFHGPQSHGHQPRRARLGPPYTALSSFTPATDGQWRDFSYDFRLPRIGSRSACFFTRPAMAVST